MFAIAFSVIGAALAFYVLGLILAFVAFPLLGFSRSITMDDVFYSTFDALKAAVVVGFFAFIAVVAMKGADLEALAWGVGGASTLAYFVTFVSLVKPTSNQDEKKQIKLDGEVKQKLDDIRLFFQGELSKKLDDISGNVNGYELDYIFEEVNNGDDHPWKMRLTNLTHSGMCNDISEQEIKSQPVNFSNRFKGFRHCIGNALPMSFHVTVHAAPKDPEDNRLHIGGVHRAISFETSGRRHKDICIKIFEATQDTCVLLKSFSNPVEAFEYLMNETSETLRKLVVENIRSVSNVQLAAASEEEKKAEATARVKTEYS